MTIDLELINEMVEQGYIVAHRHATFPLTIYNYTAKAQYERMWNPATMMCRGLILHEGNIVARPFAKFFNYNEVPLPDDIVDTMPSIVSEKLDGSLGICFRWEDEYFIATRGSFKSWQAIEATNMLRNQFTDLKIPDGITPLFEIIHPNNRIVVDYAGLETLVLLAVINNETGADVPLADTNWWTGRRTGHIPELENVEQAYAHALSTTYQDQEGVVMTWYRHDEPSFRLKAKHPRYVYLHKLLTCMSNKSIWESLKDGKESVRS